MPPKEGMLAGFKVNVSHQEVERILSEVEKWYATGYEQAGVEWLPIDGVTNFLMMDLGYEDQDEFEDAMNGSFVDFLANFPHIETKEVEGKTVFKCQIMEPQGPRKLSVTISSSQQLLDTTLFKAADAALEIPSIEFEIGAQHTRHIDSLYNHIADARRELEYTAQMTENAEQKMGILWTAEQLGAFLDVEEPLTIVIKDPSGLSEFRPMDGVTSEPL